VQAPLLLERFVVAAVVSVLMIRGYLRLTGYPQIGGHGLHIAHMLFGGILMLVALLVSLSILGPRAREIAAIVGGVGFGAFIDELGKFITSDNDYFFRPTVALIYVIFVLLFIAGERLAAERNPTPEERLAQAVDVITGDVVEGYSARQRDLAMQLLAESDKHNPLVPALQTALVRIAAAPDPEPGLAARAARRVGRGYDWLASRRWFLTAVLLIAASGVLYNLRELSLALLIDPERGRFEAVPRSTGGMLLVANLIAGVLLAIGFWHIRQSLLDAYQWFRRSVLVSLLLVQPFAFYQEQWSALIGLTVNLLVISALEFGIGQESTSPLAKGDPRIDPALSD
jgi:hypothetical protein